MECFEFVWSTPSRGGAVALQLTVRSPSIVDKMPVQQPASISAAAWGGGGRAQRARGVQSGVKVGASKWPRQLGVKPRPATPPPLAFRPCCAPETGRRPSLGTAPGWCPLGAKGCRIGPRSPCLWMTKRRANVCERGTLPLCLLVTAGPVTAMPISAGHQRDQANRGH